MDGDGGIELEANLLRELHGVAQLADKRGKKLNTRVTIHPKLLAGYPVDVGRWLGKLLNKMRIWCTRAGFGYFAIWVRENYEGDRHEHVHMLLYIRPRHRQQFEAALHRWLPGDASAILVREEEQRDKRGHHER